MWISWCLPGMEDIVEAVQEVVQLVPQVRVQWLSSERVTLPQFREVAPRREPASILWMSLQARKVSRQSE